MLKYRRVHYINILNIINCNVSVLPSVWNQGLKSSVLGERWLLSLLLYEPAQESAWLCHSK